MGVLLRCFSHVKSRNHQYTLLSTLDIQHCQNEWVLSVVASEVILFFQINPFNRESNSIDIVHWVWPWWLCDNLSQLHYATQGLLDLVDHCNVWQHYWLQDPVCRGGRSLPVSVSEQEIQTDRSNSVTRASRASLKSVESVNGELCKGGGYGYRFDFRSSCEFEFTEDVYI